jgi:hypothetical protein
MALPTILEPAVGLRSQRQNDANLATILEEQAKRLIETGQLCSGIVVLGKSMAHSQEQPNINLAKLVQSHNIPLLMENVTRKFGIGEQQVSSDTWKWPSIVFPSVQALTGPQTMETLLIKNWIGFDDALSLLGEPRLGSASPKNWKDVFRYVCSLPGYSTKVDNNGRTSLHIAVLLGMVEEVKTLLSLPDLDPSRQDKAQQTALHLAAILGHEAICDTFLSTNQARGSVLLGDYAGRLPVYYTADGGREALFQQLLEETRSHAHGNMLDIYNHRDKDGNTLLQYGIVHRLDCPELLKWTESTDIQGYYPDRHPIPLIVDLGPTLLSNNSLSQWNNDQSGQQYPYQRAQAKLLHEEVVQPNSLS